MKPGRSMFCANTGLRLIAAIAITLCSSIPVSAAEPAVPAPLPLLFDARERIAKPDLSSLVRLRFLTTTDFPPFNFSDQNAKLSGFNVDLAREICTVLEIGDKCQIQALPFGDLQAALSASQGDAVIAGISVSGALRQSFTFSRPYMMLPARFVENRKSALEGRADDALAGRGVGVVKGTVHEAMLARYFPRAKAIAFATREELLSALAAGKVDAAFADALQLSFWVASSGSAGCCALFDDPYYSERFLGEGMTIMLRQNDQALTTAIDYALATLSRNGRLQEIYLRYFPYGL